MTRFDNSQITLLLINRPTQKEYLKNKEGSKTNGMLFEELFEGCQKL